MLKRDELLFINKKWSIDIINKYKHEFKLFFYNLKKQFKYNDTARDILIKYIKTKNITSDDSDTLKQIIKDTLKMVGLGTIAIAPIPGGVLLMMFLINGAKKLNINLIPSQFESNNSDVVNIKTYDLVKLFNEINKECFFNELPPIDIVVKTLKRVTAQYTSKFKQNADKSYTVFDNKITISDLTKYSEEKLRNILCHEMIHYYVATKIDHRDNHGPNFKEHMYRINSLNLGYNVTLIDDQPGEINSEIKVNDTFFITGKYNNYRFYLLYSLNSLKKMNRNDIEKIIQYYAIQPFSEVSYYITSAPDIKKLRVAKHMLKIGIMKTQYYYLLDNIINSDKTRGISTDEIYNL